MTEALAEAIRDRMTQLGISSLRGLERRTGISYETCRTILQGRGAPTEPTLKGLADGLGLPITRLRELAGRPAGEAAPFVLPRDADQLTPRQRQVVLDVINAFVEANRRTTPER